MLCLVAEQSQNEIKFSFHSKQYYCAYCENKKDYSYEFVGRNIRLDTFQRLYNKGRRQMTCQFAKLFSFLGMDRMNASAYWDIDDLCEVEKCEESCTILQPHYGKLITCSST